MEDGCRSAETAVSPAVRARGFLLSLGVMTAGAAAAIACSSAGLGTSVTSAGPAAGAPASVQPGPAMTATTVALVVPASTLPAASPSPSVPSADPTPSAAPTGTPSHTATDSFAHADHARTDSFGDAVTHPKAHPEVQPEAQPEADQARRAAGKHLRRDYPGRRPDAGGPDSGTPADPGQARARQPEPHSGCCPGGDSACRGGV